MDISNIMYPGSGADFKEEELKNLSKKYISNQVVNLYGLYRSRG